MLNVDGKAYKEMLERRPLNVKVLWGNEQVGLVSGRDVYAACKELGCVVLAANCRNPLTAKGVLRAAKKLNAAVVLEIAKSEAAYCLGNDFASQRDVRAVHNIQINEGRCLRVAEI